MTEKPVTRDEAIAIAQRIKEQWIVAYEEIIRMPKPDPEVVEYFRGPSHSRRFAKRLRAGVSRPSWLTGTPEDLAQKHEDAAAYAVKNREVRRLANAHKRIQSQIADGTFGELRE